MGMKKNGMLVSKKRRAVDSLDIIGSIPNSV